MSSEQTRQSRPRRRRRPDTGGRRLVAVAALLLGLASVAPAQPALTGPLPPPDQAPPQPVPTPAATPAAPAPRLSLDEALGRRGDLTLRNSSLNTALLTISELWGINVVAGEVPGSVNGVFKNAPLREILDSILISNGYGYRAVGDSLVVSKLSDLGQVNPFFESATIPVLAADVTDVMTGAQLLSTPQGQIRAVPSASSIFVLDFPDRVKRIRDFVSSVDAAAQRSRGGPPVGAGPRQLQVAYLRTHYIKAADATPVLETVLSPSGRVASMESEDRLLVVDYAENLQVVATVLERIDRPRPQVSVRALIYDISLQDMEEIGVNFQSLSNGALNSLTTTGAFTEGGTLGSGAGSLITSNTITPATDGAPGSTFNFFTLSSNFNLSAVAVALQQASDSRLLASPNVTVVDNEEATIQSVSEIPVQQLTQTAAGGNIGTTAFRDAGITLRVRPKIALNNTIEMEVAPEFSLLQGFTPTTNQPIIDRRTAQTRVRIANGQTFVIAGLRQRTDLGEFSGVPMLKDVRFFGRLFRSRDTEVRESELVVFISPTIVGYDDPLSVRDRAVADTVDCRLQQIPQAEGCPAGCGGAACHAGCAWGGEAAPEEHAPLLAPEATDPPAALPAAPGSAVPTASVSGELSYPEIARRQGLRRLPAVEGDGAPSNRDRTVPDEESARTAERRLRPDYDSRFRATGGVYPSQQRSQPEAEPQEAEPSSFWGRVFSR